MEFIFSDSLSLVAIIISFFSATPIYYIYFRKKERILLTVAENKIENEKLKLSIVYSNVEYRQSIITNSFIQLNSKADVSRFTEENYLSGKDWIIPVVLSGKEHVSIILEYPLPNIVQEEKIDVVIKTCYISSEGDSYCDDFNIGFLSKNDIGRMYIYVEHLEHKLEKTKTLATIC